MPYSVYVNILLSLFFGVSHLKFATLESDKLSVYKESHSKEFIKINKNFSRLLRMNHSVVYKPILIEMLFSIAYIVVGVLNIYKYYRSGCDNWVGYSCIYNTFPILLFVDYGTFIPLVFFCRKKLKKTKKTGDR